MRVAFTYLLVVVAIARAQTTSLLTIDDAVTLAMKGNRQVQSASLGVGRAKEDTAAQKTQRLPRLDLYVLGGIPLRSIKFDVPRGAFGSYAATGPIPGQDTTVTTARQLSAFILGSVAQPLSQLWKINLDVTSSRISEDLAKESMRQQRQDTAQSVRELYYQITQTQTQIESAEATEKTLIELQRETDHRLTELAALKSDSLSVRSRLSQQRYQLINLRDAIITQKESLNVLLGRNLDTDFSVEVQPLPAVEAIDLSAAHKMALRERPEIQQARLQTKKAETAVRRKRADYIPDISLGLTYTSFPNVSFLPQNVWLAGVIMQWQQPFDWGQKRHQKQSLRDAVEQATLSERDTEQQILVDVNTKFRALAEARMLLDTRALAQETQREALREVVNRYREKAALLSDFKQQDAAAVQADSEYQSALAAFWQAKADFDRALGKE